MKQLAESDPTTSLLIIGFLSILTSYYYQGDIFKIAKSAQIGKSGRVGSEKITRGTISCKSGDDS
jgi:hypothetical protein